MSSLRDLWKAAIASTYETERLIGEYRQALSAEKARLYVPPGWEIDVLGDGRVKPANQCAPILSEASDADAPP